jgi:hypothetical protein
MSVVLDLPLPGCLCCSYEEFVADGGLERINVEGVKTLLSEIGEQ